MFGWRNVKHQAGADRHLHIKTGLCPPGEDEHLYRDKPRAGQSSKRQHVSDRAGFGGDFDVFIETDGVVSKTTNTWVNTVALECLCAQGL